MSHVDIREKNIPYPGKCKCPRTGGVGPECLQSRKELIRAGAGEMRSEGEGRQVQSHTDLWTLYGL